MRTEGCRNANGLSLASRLPTNPHLYCDEDPCLRQLWYQVLRLDGSHANLPEQLIDAQHFRWYDLLKRAIILYRWHAVRNRRQCLVLHLGNQLPLGEEQGEAGSRNTYRRLCCRRDR